MYPYNARKAPTCRGLFLVERRRATMSVTLEQISQRCLFFVDEKRTNGRWSDGLLRRSSSLSRPATLQSRRRKPRLTMRPGRRPLAAQKQLGAHIPSPLKRACASASSKACTISVGMSAFRPQRASRKSRISSQGTWTATKARRGTISVKRPWKQCGLRGPAAKDTTFNFDISQAKSVGSSFTPRATIRSAPS